MSAIDLNLKNQNKNINKKQGKREKEILYSTLFPPYVFHEVYHVYFINSCTLLNDIDYIIAIVRHTFHFIFDTESDIGTNQPALIQIACFPADDQSIIVLLVEIQHLPDRSSYLFLKYQQLFALILREQTHVYAWGNITKELDKFLSSSLFSFPLCTHLHNIQNIFKKWFNEYISLKSIKDPDDDSLDLHAPVHDPELFIPAHVMNQIKLNTNNLWSLPDAVVYSFSQYLSKCETLRQWSIGLDRRLTNVKVHLSNSHRQQLINYAVNDCLSVLHIIIFIHEQHLYGYVENNLHIQDMGEYFVYLNNKYFPVSSSVSSSINYEKLYDVLFQDDEEEVDARKVHEANEHPSSFFFGSSYPTTTTSQHAQSSYIPPSSAVDVLPTIPPVVAAAVEVVPPAAVVNESVPPTTITTITTKKKQKQRRSVEARKRRSQQASQCHRKNRYTYEIQRSTKMGAKQAKQILRALNIQTKNVNKVKSIMYVGLTSQEDQQRYDQVLPMDIFM